MPRVRLRRAASCHSRVASAGTAARKLSWSPDNPFAGRGWGGGAPGVVVTALIQSALAGLGLWVCGVPHPGLLTAAIFVLCIAQLGPFPVLIPAMIWMFSNQSIGWALAFLIWSIPGGIMDNFLRPILISRGVDLPLLLIIGGVIGGLIAFGVIGLFVGPVVLA